MKYDLNGVLVLNKFIWARLKSELGMTEADYSGLVPIIPTQQEPVFNNVPAGRPFIIYTHATGGYDTDTWSNVEQVTYRIFGDDERRLRQVTNFITDLCKRYDWSADDANTWIEFEANYPVDADDRKFEFKWITVVGGNSPEPYTQEGGRQYSTVSIRLAYIHRENGRVGGNNLGLRS